MHIKMYNLLSYSVSIISEPFAKKMFWLTNKSYLNLRFTKHNLNDHYNHSTKTKKIRQLVIYL